MSEIQIITREQYMGTYRFEYVEDICKCAKEYDHKFWINGIPVGEKFYQYVIEFKAKWSDVILCVDDPARGRAFNLDGVNWYSVYNDFGISAIDAPKKRLGKLFIEGENYGVQSPSIENNKFKASSYKHHTRKSRDMKKMLKIARQAIKPPSLNSLYNDYKYAAEDALQKINSPARAKLRSIFGIEVDHIADEAANMLRMGYVPITKSFHDALDLVRGEGAELKRLRDYKPRMCFVWAKQKSVAYRYSDSTEEIEIVDLNELAADLHNKLGVLNIAAIGSPIADVGVRVSDEIFLVFV